MPRRKVRSKTIKLNPDVWVRNAGDVKIRRQQLFKLQGSKCAVTGHKTLTPVLDHSHANASTYTECGRVRGVLDSQVNMLEGRFLRLYQKSKIGEKCDITFEDFLINLGNYLKRDNQTEQFHFHYMDAQRKVVKRWRKEVLLLRLEEDFGIVADSKTLMSELVQIYMQNWVYEVEKLY